MQVESPKGTGSETICTPGLHARIGELAGNPRCSANEERDWAVVAAADVNVTPQEEIEMTGRLTFGEDDGTVGADALGGVRGNPGVLVFGEAIELGNGAQCRDDLGHRSWLQRRSSVDVAALGGGAHLNIQSIGGHRHSL